MAKNPRQIGGKANKEGNQYETLFALSKVVVWARWYVLSGEPVWLSEQAACPVDDLVIKLSARHYHYFQLKNDQAITWGENGNKLANEFLAQKTQCEARKQKFALHVVVSEKQRETSLTNNMPVGLGGVTTIVLFPAIGKPSELAKRRVELLLDLALLDLIARKFPQESDLEQLVFAFLIAWLERDTDARGFSDLSDLVEDVLKRRLAMLRHRWKSRPKIWRKAKKILLGIPGLSWRVDRGYLEYEYGSTDTGIYYAPCSSPEFNRFLKRLVRQKPSNFGVFEGLL